MLNILVNGILGRMGHEIVIAAQNFPNAKIICGVDKEANSSFSFPVYSSAADIKETVDVIIDFSIPQASMIILDYAKCKSIPIVIATTGFSDEQKQIIKEASSSIPVFQSANMSYEINLMASILKKLATSLPDSDIEIVEAHHRNKIDAPSGTALLLADSINQALESKLNYTYERHSKHEKRPSNEIGISSIRGGTEAGKHTVMFLGENETLELTHTATSRSVFAKGAIKAAEFIVTQNAGLYSMNNLI